MTDTLITQDAIEVLSDPFGPTRITQVTIEVLGTVSALGPALGARVTQAAVEVLTPTATVTTVPVPDVKGKDHAQAVADLIAAGLVPGHIFHEHSPTVPPGKVIRTDPEPPAVVPPGTPVDLVMSLGPLLFVGTGTGPIANLPGKVTATHALLVSAAVSTSLSASLDGATAYTDAVLIPAPGPTERILVRRLSASTLVAGPFSVRFASNGTPVRGPIWLPSGAAAQTTGRLFTTGPTAIVLPPGQGLTVTTSADAPQTIEADYEIVGT